MQVVTAGENVRTRYVAFIRHARSIRAAANQAALQFHAELPACLIEILHGKGFLCCNQGHVVVDVFCIDADLSVRIESLGGGSKTLDRIDSAIQDVQVEIPEVEGEVNLGAGSAAQ